MLLLQFYFLIGEVIGQSVHKRVDPFDKGDKPTQLYFTVADSGKGIKITLEGIPGCLQIVELKNGIRFLGRSAPGFEIAFFNYKMGCGAIRHPHLDGTVRQIQGNRAHFKVMLSDFFYPESSSIKGYPDTESKCIGVGQ